MSASDRSAAALERIANALERFVAMHQPPAPPGEEVASDADLDSNYGDVQIRKDPRDWNGDSFVGMHMSDAPADYLDMLAGFLSWKAGKNEDDAAKETDAVKKDKLKKYARYARTDAARARGWARRKRNGWEPRRQAEEDSGGDDGSYNAPEIPF